MANHNEISSFIWQIADLLRGPYRPPQYERVMLPMTVLRRFDCVLAPSKEKVLREYEKRKGGKLNDEALDKFLNRAAGQRFHNHSPLTFEKLKGDPDHIEKHLTSYINGFSANVRQIFEYFEFSNEIEKMREANILFLVVSKFCDIDLHPDNLDNIEMGLLFENLIRRFNELANETAGDHFTPREVIRLMVNLLFINDDALLATAGTVRKLLDPACGTGGMLAEAQNYLREHHPQAKLYVYGQEYNNRAFAVAASDMLIKQVDHNGTGENIRFGDTFTDDQFRGETFDYLLANPPFGVDWKKQQKFIEDEHNKRGFAGRFGAGLPRVNDGVKVDLEQRETRRLKFLLDANDGGVWGDDPGTSDVDVPVLRSTEQLLDGKWQIRDPATRSLTYDEFTKAQLKSGDVIITKSSGSSDHIGKTSQVTKEIEAMGCAFSNFMQRLHPSKKLDSTFLTYVLNSQIGREQFRFLSTTTTGLGNLSAEIIGDIEMPLLPVTEQRTIAGYLDRETGRLDALVAAKERWLDLLAEKRSALMTRAVTRGLEPSVALRDSGLNWLREIPSHWETKRLKYIASLQSGDGITSEEILESGEYPVFGGNGIRGYSSRFNHQGDYVLIGRQGALCGNINYATGRFWASEHAVVATIRGQDQVKWLGELLSVMNLNQYSQSAAQPGLSVDLVGNLSLPVPPVDEQRAIVAYISAETAKLDALRAATERTIGLLKERRAALIAAAVTGRIEVGRGKQ
jgi:restriction endonuclease S subunit